MENIKEILNQYDIPETSPIRMIHESGDNYTYLVGDKYKKVLRVGKKLPKEDIYFEYEVLNYLNSKNFLVPEWVKTKNGDIYASTKGIDVAVMFDFLDGYHATVDRENLPTKKQAYIAGNSLGLMAKIGEGFKTTLPRQRDIFTELERVLKNEKTFKKDFEGGEVFVEQVKEFIKFGLESKSKTGLIQNDYRPGNVFFINGDMFNGIIDFDWSCIGPTIKDLALGVLEWSFPDGRSEPDFNVFDAFLEGYNSTASEKIEKGSELYSWIKFAALSDTATFFCDRLTSSQLKKKITSSYMYKKFLFFSTL